MPFQLRPYFPPVFSTPALENAPDAVFRPAPRDGVAPENFHAMSIFPEYFKIAGQWHLARESRMDCVAVWDRGRIDVREFRRLRQGELVAVGRTEQGEEGILVHPDGFRERRVARDVFAFRQGRSRETAFSRDYDELYELLRHERDHGKVVWVMGPAFAFDHDARNAFSRLIAGGFVHAVLAGNTLYTSGQLGLDPVSGELAAGVEAQAKQALENLRAVLETAGMDFQDVTKTTVFLSDMGDFAAINAIYAQYFTGEAPARSCVQVAALPKGAAFEIEAVAVK